MQRTSRKTARAPAAKSAPARKQLRPHAAAAIDDDAKMRRLVLDLQLHQAELQAQNAELRDLRLKLEAGLASYTALYEEAPVGYLSLDGRGRIVRSNLAAAALLGVSREALKGMPLSTFVYPSGRGAYTAQLKVVRAGTGNGRLEVSLLPTGSDAPLAVRLDIARDVAGRTLRVVLTDLTGVRAQAALSATKIEQTRLRADLHDGLGQELAGLSFSLHALQRHAEEHDSADAAELKHLANAALHAVGSCRQIVQAYTSVCREAGGLIPAVEQLVERTRVLRGPSLALALRGSVPHDLSNAVADHLYRIVQEALNNAAKHAYAAHIRIEIDANDSSVMVRVSDDGVGLAAQSEANAGIGLRVMQARAAAIGARLSVAPRPGGGTEVRCDLGRVAGAGAMA